MAAAGGLVRSSTSALVVRAGCEGAFADWQAAFARVVSGAPGFLSLEMTASGAGWTLVQRFQGDAALAGWRDSPVRLALVAELNSLREAGGDDPLAVDPEGSACVTEVITTLVAAGRLEAFLGWSERLQRRQGRFAGYLGTMVQAPVSAEVPYWTTLVRFATSGQLDAWMQSSDRAALLVENDGSLATWESRRPLSPFAGWFPAPKEAPPPAWKQTMLVLLVLFPVVMLEIRFLNPFMTRLPSTVATFIGNALSVSLVAWPLMGVAVGFMGWWLTPAPGKSAGGSRRRGWRFCWRSMRWRWRFSVSFFNFLQRNIRHD